MHARNLSLVRQKYSLAITGCLSEDNQAAKTPTKTPTHLQSAATGKSACSEDRLFELEMNTDDTGNQLSWSLIGSTDSNGVDIIMDEPGMDPFENFKNYYYSKCLDQAKYRFQIRNTAGYGIAGSRGNGNYKISFGGSVIFDSRSSSTDFGYVSNHKFEVTTNGHMTLGTKRAVTFMLTTESEISTQKHSNSSSELMLSTEGDGLI